MKKFTSLILIVLSLLMMLSLASCNKETTSEIINNAVKKTNALKEYEAKMDIVIDMSMAGMTMNIPMNVVTKVKNADTDTPTVLATTKTSVFGQEITTETYMDDEYVYVSMDGEGYKMSIEDSDGEYDYASDIDDMLKNLPNDLIENIELTKNNDGSLTLNVNIPKEAFVEIFDDFVEDMNEASGGASIDGVEISNCKVAITVKDDYIKNYDISFNMEMTVEGMKTNSCVTAKMEFVNPGNAVTITPMDGYESFEEFDGLD